MLAVVMVLVRRVYVEEILEKKRVQAGSIVSAGTEGNAPLVQAPGLPAG
jgi:hypothetical protein